jgi:protein-S-isoprenylcysteine O-methyltransferase Ste14
LNIDSLLNLRTFFEQALLLLFVISAVIAGVLFFINAPYGRHMRKGWGPSIPGRWGWVIMETPAVAVILFLFLTGDHGPVSIAFILLWQSHYLYRTYIFPFRLRGARKPMPVVIVLMAIVFNVWNGFLNGTWLFHLSPVQDVSWFFSPQFIGGVVLFYGGMFINRQSDNILLNLRKPGETGYRIPYGGFYRYVSMPSYLGEVIQWFGFAVATWSLPGLAFAVFTLANLLPRAVANHKWYKKTFADYPENRKAIIPFII